MKKRTLSSSLARIKSEFAYAPLLWEAYHARRINPSPWIGLTTPRGGSSLSGNFAVLSIAFINILKRDLSYFFNFIKFLGFFNLRVGRKPDLGIG